MLSEPCSHHLEELKGLEFFVVQDLFLSETAQMADVVLPAASFVESPTNMITNPALDPVSKIPELKVCAVRVEKELA